MQYKWVPPTKPRKSLTQFMRVPDTDDIDGCVKIVFDNGDLVYVHVVESDWTLVATPELLKYELDNTRLNGFIVDPNVCVGECLVLTALGGHWQTTSRYISTGLITKIVPLRKRGRVEPRLGGRWVHYTSSDYH